MEGVKERKYLEKLQLYLINTKKSVFMVIQEGKLHQKPTLYINLIEINCKNQHYKLVSQAKYEIIRKLN